MDTNKKVVVDVEETVSNSITLTFTIKKLFVVACTVLTFLSSTAGPIGYSLYQKKIAAVEEKIKLQYEQDLKSAKCRAEEGEKIKLEFSAVVSQMQTTVDFLKLHATYSTCYIRYAETPDVSNKKRFDDIVIKYAYFIKKRKTFANAEDITSFYLSDEIVYIDGIKYIIPQDVLYAVKDIKNAN